VSGAAGWLAVLFVALGQPSTNSKPDSCTKAQGNNENPKVRNNKPNPRTDSRANRHSKKGFVHHCVLGVDDQWMANAAFLHG